MDIDYTLLLSSLVFSLFLVIDISLLFFFFNATATTEIYTLSLHDALPICRWSCPPEIAGRAITLTLPPLADERSEEHTSELQSRFDLVCRLLLEKKKKTDHLSDHQQLSYPQIDQLVRLACRLDDAFSTLEQ